MRMLKDVLNNVIRAGLCHATDHYLGKVRISGEILLG